jgi:hypothetical protein
LSAASTAERNSTDGTNSRPRAAAALPLGNTRASLAV